MKFLFGLVLVLGACYLAARFVQTDFGACCLVLACIIGAALVVAGTR